ncbi:MAG TPA: hypothetical protein VIF14_10960 [Alphaproteobacteria bacterium]
MIRAAQLLVAAALFLAGIVSAAAQAREVAEPVDVYLFWSRTCPHCERALEFLERLGAAEPRLRLHKFEVESGGGELFRRANEKFAVDRPAVPMIVIGERVLIGYGDDRSTGASIVRYVRACLASACPDLIKPLLAKEGGGQPQIERPPPPRTVKLPLIGEIETARLSLPLLTIVMAAVDGFNPCAMWGLVFLLGLLIGLEDRRRMWVLGGAFIAVSALVYFAIMAAWLNVLLLLGALVWIRVGVALVALAGGVYYLREFARGEAVCQVTAPAGRRRLLDRLKDMAQRRRVVLALLGVAALAVAVNLIDLLCSAGLPAVYTEVLTQSRLPLWQYYAYLALYILVFMADDLLVFATAMATLTLSGFATRYTRFSKLVGGVVLAGIGGLLLFRPEWLSFR